MSDCCNNDRQAITTLFSIMTKTGNNVGPVRSILVIRSILAISHKVNTGHNAQYLTGYKPHWCNMARLVQQDQSSTVPPWPPVQYSHGHQYSTAMTSMLVRVMAAGTVPPCRTVYYWCTTAVPHILQYLGLWHPVMDGPWQSGPSYSVLGSWHNTNYGYVMGSLWPSDCLITQYTIINVRLLQ